MYDIVVVVGVFMDKDANIKFSYIFYSIIIILLGAMDFISTMNQVIRSGAGNNTLTETQLKIVIASSTLLGLWVALSKIYVGAQGLGKLKGKEVNKYTRVFTMIMIVFNAVILIACVAVLIKNMSAISNTSLVFSEFFIWLMFRIEVIKN